MNSLSSESARHSHCKPTISAVDLYNFTQSAHRVYLDAHGDPAQKGEVSKFVQLLWEKGLQTEREYSAALNVPDYLAPPRKIPRLGSTITLRSFNSSRLAWNNLNYEPPVNYDNLIRARCL